MTSRRILKWAGLSAVVLVPLAFAGLFVGAIGGGNESLEHIPVAVVNEDEMQTVPQADGSDQIVFAGRQLVTELVGAEGFDWTITNSEDADAALKAGDVYAVLTVPKNFSTSILSLSGADPQQADISIRTDDAHSYLTGSVAQVVGQTMTDTFGKAITAQYIGGIYSSLGELGGSLTAAADGASQLANGAASLSSGLSQYTDGVDSLAYGLSQLEEGAAGLSQLSGGVSQYAGGIAQLSALMSSIDLSSVTDPMAAAQLAGVRDGLAQAANGGAALSGQASAAVSGIQSGIAQSADGAWQLSSGGGALVDGANGLASGATDLATGLTAGAAQIPATDADAAAASAEVAADPVGLSVTTDNAVTEVGQVVATFFVPLGLWIGALAVFLVLRPVTRRALVSTARNGRLVATAILRASAVTAAQAALLVVLLHGAIGVSWALLPATLGFSLLTALAFTAFHYLLTIGLGRAGLVVSLFLLAVQVTSTGGIYPIELLATPFQVISPFLPLTWAVDGMQGIIAGGSAGSVIGSALVLAAFGIGSALLALFAIRRTRRASALGLVPETA
ncbi:YhgE/Pip family protein [Leifsonia sp. H3M29-4]|uniref:YhgE/Pip family protein n=1 Tax=Salinibacterium metalliresistens TaxID=3031321 RepID=UPI0023D9F3DD|nr:YhgE/Pip family protein [Salinibacterium metalliresistens]MDF1479234.1 YhgE/Pip family protein [Salinibacterium metalliresistens]